MVNIRCLIAVIVAFSALPITAQVIPAADASKHLGETGTVCGRIEEVKVTTNVRGTPTFIDFEKPYPNETFVAVIWEHDKASVGAIPRVGTLCVKGTITDYKGRPQIALHARSDWSTSRTTLSNDNHYRNSDGQVAHSPAYSSGGVPAGATAQCADGTYSFSQHRQGTCSHHGGVAKWF
jgi:hypothetical protein